MTLKVNVEQWNKLTPSAYYANWHEKALNVNEDIGCLETCEEDGSCVWIINNTRKGVRPIVKLGFSKNGEFFTHVITRKYKDPAKKVFNRSDVEEIVLNVVNAVGAFYKAGILIGVDEPQKDNGGD